MTSNPKNSAPRYLLLGKIQRPHGVRGELRIKLLTDYPERINDLETVYVGKSPEASKIDAYEVIQMRFHKDGGILKVKGITDRNQAERLSQLHIMVDVENAVPLEDDEIYLYQLIGMTVKTEEEELGTISEVIETGANDVYVVRGGSYGEVLVPITEETLLETNVEEGYVLVRLPEGLLPEE